MFIHVSRWLTFSLRVIGQAVAPHSGVRHNDPGHTHQGQSRRRRAKNNTVYNCRVFVRWNWARILIVSDAAHCGPRRRVSGLPIFSSTALGRLSRTARTTRECCPLNHPVTESTLTQKFLLTLSLAPLERKRDSLGTRQVIIELILVVIMLNS